MMKVLGTATAYPDEIRSVERRETRLRKTVLLACSRAMVDAGFQRTPKARIVGVVCKTTRGDRYPELYSKKIKMAPHEFGSSVLNSVIGPTMIELAFIGPQVVVTDGSASDVAKVMLEQQRCGIMLVVIVDEEVDAVSVSVNVTEDG